MAMVYVNGSYVLQGTSPTAYFSSISIGYNSVSFTAVFVNNSSTNTHTWSISGTSGISSSSGNVPPNSTITRSRNFTVGENTSGIVDLVKLGPNGGVLGQAQFRFTTGFSYDDTPPPPATFTVPNVVGQLNTTAVTNLTNAGAGSVTQSFTETGATTVNNRRVISQSPAAGTTVNVGSTVSINSYDLKLQVPNILGLTQTAANVVLDNAGFTLRTSSLTTTGATVANNLLVATQNPTGGTQYNPLDTVTYALFNFLTAVPNVVGQLQDTAFTNLGNLGFTSITVTLDEVGATTANVGTVKSQNPVNSSTTYNPANTSVSLVVYSLGVTGKRYTGTGFTALTNAKRYDGTSWIQMTIQKRFDGSVWRDISN
jgi:beta-lactam-binding protein with PASTA domain